MKTLFMILSVIVSVLDTTICMDSTITLSSTYDKAHYRWTDKATGMEVGTARSYVFSPTAEGDYNFTCEPYNDSTELHDVMEGANGDFENGYTGFTSEFLPISKGGVPVVNPTNIYGGQYDNGTWSPSGKKGYYMITNNAQVLQSDASIFKPIKPHGGNEFLLVDAYTAGYAWKVENLTVQPGITYEFSYWATTPNARTYELGFKAKLQFIISYQDAYGFTTSDSLLSTPHELGTEPGDEKWEWHQRKATWTAPAGITKVTIGVKDLNISADGNDFCLDDIVFMPQGQPQAAIVETFHVNVVDCTPVIPCVDLIYSKWNDVLVVNNDKDTLATYQWYRDGAPVEGATLQYLRDTEVAGHTYWVKGKTVSGKPYEACEVTFDAAPRSATLVQQDAPTPVAVRRHFVGAHLVIEETIYSDDSREVVKRVY